MRKQEKIRGLIISRRNVGEADRLITIFTREHGLLRVEARGVRKIPSRRGGHLEPLTYVLCVVAHADSRHFLAGVETINPFIDLHAYPLALRYITQLSRLLGYLFEEEQAQPVLFDALIESCQILPRLLPEKQRLLEIAVSLLALKQAGVAPDLKACGHCRQTQPVEAAILLGQLGGWRCLSCHTSFSSTSSSLSPRCLRALQWIAKNAQQALRLKVDENESKQLQNAVQDYLMQALSMPPLPATAATEISYA